jgi:hypothetical protein
VPTAATIRLRAVVGAVLTLLSLVAGCGAAGSGSVSGGSAATAAATASPTRSHDPTPAAAGATVLLVRTGGLLPGSAAVRVAPDGSVRQGTSAQALGPPDRTLSAAETARLQAALRDPALRAWTYSAEGACCDRRLLQLTVSGLGPTFTVRTVEGGAYPAALAQVLTALVPLLPQTKVRPTVAPR